MKRSETQAKEAAIYARIKGEIKSFMDSKKRTKNENHERVN